MEELSFLCIGDIVGKPGRTLLQSHLKPIQEHYGIDFTVVNIENAAAGFGVTSTIYEDLQNLSIDAYTLGNHAFSRKESLHAFSSMKKLIRPLNFVEGVPGVGVRFFDIKSKTVAVINLIGRVFMGACDCPFQKINSILGKVQKESDFIFVDFHAEASSEKVAMGWHLDGKVTAVFGTHTHVQTSDERLLEKGTAYITDIGMTGPRDGVIGMDREPIIKKFLNQMPVKFSPSKCSMGQFNGIVVTINSETKKALSILRIQKEFLV